MIWIMLVMTAFTACTSLKVDPCDFVKVEFKGADGYGKAEVMIDYDKLYDKARSRIKGNEYSYKQVQEMFYESGDFEIDYDIDQDDALSNGDVVTVSLDWDNKELKKYGIRYSGDKKITFEVEVLPEARPVDPFDQSIFENPDQNVGVHVNYAGCAPEAVAFLKMGTKSSKIENSIEYTIEIPGEKKTVDSGDLITIRASLKGADNEGLVMIDGENYMLTRNELQYRTDDIPVLVGSLKDLDSVQMNAIWNVAEEAFRKHVDRDWSTGHSFLEEIEYLGRFYIEISDQERYVGVFFRYVAYNKNETYDIDGSKEVFDIMLIPNLVIDGKGEISLDVKNVSIDMSHETRNADYYYYWGTETLEEIRNYVEKIREDANVFEIDMNVR